MTEQTKPSPATLYSRAAGNPVAYRKLLEEHGYIVPRAHDAEGRPVFTPEEMERRRADPVETLAATVHGAWRDGMLAQGRTVAAERLHWATLPEMDRALDREIASEVIRVMCTLEPAADYAQAEAEITRLNWMTLVKTAHAYRIGGHAIPTRMEEEMGFMLQHLLGLARVHGMKWREAASAELKAMQDSLETAKAAEQRPA